MTGICSISIGSRRKRSGLKVLSGLKAGGICVQCGGNHNRRVLVGR